MTFNIEYGGTVVDFDKILAAVRRADADVVAFNEVYGKAARLGRLTGYDYVSRRLDLVSRYPLLDRAGVRRPLRLRASSRPGRSSRSRTCTCASSDYGPRRLLDGWSRKKVLRTERRRAPARHPAVPAVDGAPAAATASRRSWWAT